MTNYLLAGGGTAGHVNPLLALADEIMLESKSNKVWALGTIEGLESRLVPEKGYELLIVPRLPMPRKLNRYALSFPSSFRASVDQVKEYIISNKIDSVVGFGGYASAPAYRAAKALNIPYVIHEANAMPGYANRVGAKSANAVGITFRNTKLPRATFVGMPIREEIIAITKGDFKSVAAKYFGLDPRRTTLLVTGGSLGAKRINETIEASRKVLDAAGIQVLHIVGERAELSELHEGTYNRLVYCDRMDLALAVADFVVSRAGAATVSELCAIGLPSVLVPYPVGNGEQKLNAVNLVEAGGALVVADANFNLDFVSQVLVPLVSDTKRRVKMAEQAKTQGVIDGSKRLLNLVNGVLKG